MEVRQIDIRHLMENIWGEMLHTDVQPLAELPPPDVIPWRAQIRITGDWNGRLVLECSEGALDGALAGMNPGATSSARDMADVLLELANMTGGSMKSLAQGICELSLPQPLRQADGADDGVCIADAAYLCGGHPVRLRLLEQAN